MTLKKQLSLAFLNFILVLSFAHAGIDPLGQSANYKIDKDPKRTSSMLKSGTIKISVPGEAKDLSQGPAYRVKIDYDFNISLMGPYKGTKETQIEKEYFSEEFLENLRKTGHYEGQYFKADHLGYADAKNLDGKFYPHCDKILLYDLKEPATVNFFNEFLGTLANPEISDREDIQDVKVLAHVYVGVPVLGAVKVDVSGIYQGMAVKAGGDYMAR
ncbi:MAG: hypothetical protein ACKOA8_20195 [Deltaproteobacteria bacterium]